MQIFLWANNWIYLPTLLKCVTVPSEMPAILQAYFRATCAGLIGFAVRAKSKNISFGTRCNGSNLLIRLVSLDASNSFEVSCCAISAGGVVWSANNLSSALKDHM